MGTILRKYFWPAMLLIAFLNWCTVYVPEGSTATVVGNGYGYTIEEPGVHWVGLRINKGITIYR